MAFQDIDLITKAQHGDIAAFEELIFRYDKNVLGIAAQFVHSAEDAKDIYQEVLIRVFKGLPKFRFQSEFSTWMYRIATNVCLTHTSGRQKHKHHSLDESGDESDEHHRQLSPVIVSADPQPDEAMMNEELAGQVRTALGYLSPQQRLVFTLKHYQGLKLRDIASMMQCTEGTVKKHLFTAMQRMRKHLLHAMD
ncbi:MAG TPA: sigma-70 family RNA polymerase sigma factor [Bacteroidota bacterium]|nr:sigma-70 family RNA polymerase sigma factor [Bacteroidota bacterium]